MGFKRWFCKKFGHRSIVIQRVKEASHGSNNHVRVYMYCERCGKKHENVFIDKG